MIKEFVPHSIMLNLKFLIYIVEVWVVLRCYPLFRLWRKNPRPTEKRVRRLLSLKQRSSELKLQPCVVWALVKLNFEDLGDEANEWLCFVITHLFWAHNSFISGYCLFTRHFLASNLQ